MDDLISKQTVIDKINERQRKLIYCFGFENDMVKIMDIAKSIVIAIPPVQSERKKGRWIGKYPVTSVCSECNYLIHDSKVKVFAYCPNCGSFNGGGNDEV